ncbi:unnamed protein product, partial [Meganyctiphanes norvegica]
TCPPTRGFAPPRQCSSDGACTGVDKCCFDNCLQHHTCKPPFSFAGVNPAVTASGSASCRRWCRTPQGQAYCCESSNEPLTPAVTKPGRCHPVLPACPPIRGFAPPRQCSSDGACPGVDKCCFDNCLQHHTCKPPLGLGK